MAVRVASTLGALADIRVVVHSLHQQPGEQAVGEFDLRPLGRTRSLLAKPLTDVDSTILEIDRMPSQGFQINEIVLRGSLLSCLAESPEARHVLVSFSLVRLGYTVQRLAEAFGLRHIAMVTGSDYAIDFADPANHGAAIYVLTNAEWILTTNRQQEEMIGRIANRRERISTFHGALPAGLPRRLWRPHGTDVLRVVSDCGYSYKKATHMLIDACARLRCEGYPLRLSIVGSTPRREKAFWSALRRDHGHAGWASFGDPLPKEELEEFLLTGDIHCSASLSEGSSNAVLFALALGMPMVCGSTGSLPDLNDDPRDLLHPFTPGDPEFSGLRPARGRQPPCER